MIRKASLWVPVVLAIMAWRWFPLEVWISVNQGLIAFLGLLAAAVIPVIPVTASFLQSDHLFPHEAEQLSAALENQQRFWLGLLATTLATFILVLVISAIKPGVSIDIAITQQETWSIAVSPIASGIITAALSFLMLKMGSVLLGVMSLQRLRSALVITGAKRRAAAEAERQVREAALPQNIVPPDYGKIIRPH